MISGFYTTSFTQKRFATSGNQTQVATVATISGHLQQLDIQEITELGESFVSTHKIWVAVSSDVRVGDRLINGSDEYLVKAVQNNNYGQNSHLEIMAELSTAYVSV